jgi:hypothetical protein
MTFDSSIIRKHAEQYDSKIFKQNLVDFIEKRL